MILQGLQMIVEMSIDSHNVLYSPSVNLWFITNCIHQTFEVGYPLVVCVIVCEHVWTCPSVCEQVVDKK